MIFTYAAGYVSDVFIPDAFNHGITYVRSPVDRRDAGLNADRIARVYDDLPLGKVQTLLRDFDVSTVQSLMRGRRWSARHRRYRGGGQGRYIQQLAVYHGYTRQPPPHTTTPHQ